MSRPPAAAKALRDAPSVSRATKISSAIGVLAAMVITVLINIVAAQPCDGSDLARSAAANRCRVALALIGPTGRFG